MGPLSSCSTAWTVHYIWGQILWAASHPESGRIERRRIVRNIARSILPTSSINILFFFFVAGFPLMVEGCLPSSSASSLRKTGTEM
jgi:hypothetical protein